MQCDDSFLEVLLLDIAALDMCLGTDGIRDPPRSVVIVLTGLSLDEEMQMADGGDVNIEEKPQSLATLLHRDWRKASCFIYMPRGVCVVRFKLVNAIVSEL